MEQLNETEQDKMAEVSQICMGHAATALHKMIGKEIKISTPMLKLINGVDIKNIITAFGMGSVTVQIDCKDGFDMNTLMMLKANDIKIIMDLMMGGTGTAGDGELNEMHLSCVSEVMNQMMGAAATALTDMVHKTIDINTPNATLVGSKEDVDKINYLPFSGNQFVIVVLNFESKGLIKGILMRIYSMKEVKYICENATVK